MRFQIGDYVYWRRPGDALLRRESLIYQVIDCMEGHFPVEYLQTSYGMPPVAYAGVPYPDSYRICAIHDIGYWRIVDDLQLEPVPPLIVLGLQAG